jgi:hypothetical protein
MRKILTLIPGFVCTLAFSQTNIIKGRIYFSDSQPVDAYIQLSAAERTPQSFLYSADIKGPFVVIQPGNAKKVELSDGSVYEAHLIRVPAINKEYLNRRKEDYTYSENMDSGIHFVERILDGNVRFYQYLDAYQHPHFFYAAVSDTTLTYLVHDPFVDESFNIRNNNTYKNQISFFAGSVNCSRVSDQKLQGTRYVLRDLLPLFTELNKCSGSTVSAPQILQSKKPVFNFGLMGGILSSGMGQSNYNRSTDPAFGIYADMTPGKSYKNYKLSFEAVYYAHDHQTDSVIHSIIHSQESVKFTTLQLNPVARLFLAKKTQTAFIETGIHISYIFKYTVTEVSKDVVFNAVTRKTATGNEFAFYGLIAGVGYDFGRTQVSLRYSITVNSSWSGHNYLGLLAKIRLTNK